MFLKGRYGSLLWPFSYPALAGSEIDVSLASLLSLLRSPRSRSHFHMTRGHLGLHPHLLYTWGSELHNHPGSHAQQVLRLLPTLTTGTSHPASQQALAHSSFKTHFHRTGSSSLFLGYSFFLECPSSSH